MKKMITLVLITVLAVTAFTGCKGKNASPGASSNTAANAAGVEIKGIVDLVPHSELINHVKDQLAAEGVIVNLVATAADETTNERTEAGEIDFNFHQHQPYLNEWNQINGGHLINVGDIHVEPISAYSDKYKTVSEVPANAAIAIPNNATNEFRALRILEIAGFIKLDETANRTLQASVSNVKEYIKPIKLIELDAGVIIPTRGDFDVFITNVNRALEAGIDSAVLFREGEDSPYANIIVIRNSLADGKRAAVDKLVKALQSDETRKFILEKYNGKVIPAKL
ncbi:MAG: methionine ABC transporter substrate-binding protein [Treponema sp.]|jgi:D-methionine transport system substrate-binding protein|nr:methionine ABC transporter substrate-binding protein [Treponema sp.]